MRPTNKKRAYKYGVDYANQQFQDFNDHPEYRGKNFTWKNFPNSVAKMASASVFVIFRHKPKNLDILKIRAFNGAYRRCESLVKVYKL